MTGLIKMKKNIITLATSFMLIMAWHFPAAHGEEYKFKEMQYSREHIKMISVAAPEWKGITHENGEGLYWEIVKEIYEPIGIKVKINTMPFNRALKIVGKYQIINAVAGLSQKENDTFLYANFPLEVSYLYIFSVKGINNKFSTLEDFADKTVSWQKGYDLITKEDRFFKLKTFRELEPGIDNLLKNKVDYLICELDDLKSVLGYFDKTLVDIHYVKYPVGEESFLAFANNNINKELINIYNERMIELTKSGRISDIYKKWNIKDIPDSVTALVTN